MNENDQTFGAPDPLPYSDRRVRRTREAIQEAFAALVRSKGFTKLRVREILEAADIGRSTFYSHFRDKEDLLFQTIAPIIDNLASLAAPEFEEGPASFPFEHMLEERRTATAFLLAPSMHSHREALTRNLAGRIAADLTAEVESRGQMPSIPIRLIAHHAAAGILGTARAWLEDPRTPPIELATYLHRATRASIEAHHVSGRGESR